MGAFMKEFKEFIAKGNVMDMAVGVIIGGAFTAIVNSLVGDIIQPLIAGITGGEESLGMVIKVGAAEVNVGAFISAVINFLIIAWIVFLMVKALNKMQSLAAAPEVPEEAPEPIVCPHCLEEVKEGATRCPHCGSSLE